MSMELDTSWGGRMNDWVDDNFRGNSKSDPIPSGDPEDEIKYAQAVRCRAVRATAGNWKTGADIVLSVVPMPEARIADGAGSIGRVLRNDDELVTVFRHVREDPRFTQYEEALQGIVTPRGGHSDPELHQLGDTDSIFTSWSLDRLYVYQRARAQGGVMLEDSVPANQLIKTNPGKFQEEKEVLRIGQVTGAKVRVFPNPRR